MFFRGDITASVRDYLYLVTGRHIYASAHTEFSRLQSEASRQPVAGLLYDSRVSGGILADGVNGLLSALFTNAPLSIFAQNNGVIRYVKLTRGRTWCASH